MTVFEPVDDGIVIAVRYFGVTKDAMLHAFVEGFDYKWCCFEVHIGDPHRDDASWCIVPLIAVASSSLNYFVKIVLFHLILILLAS